MFYSQTFLARKGPLGTVWCAAHLQSRLKKSHYTSTDIPSTVDRIMFPDVPIALRMSGHLLVGVVRIYSKKVDYLYQECNFVLTSLRKAFPSIDLDLPENARQAPVQSITLPDTFDLDALVLDYDLSCEGFYDNNVRSKEDISIPDQIPTGKDPYVVIQFDEDIQMNSPYPTEGFGSDNMDVDIISKPTAEAVHSPGNHSDEHTSSSGGFNHPEVEFSIQDPIPSNQIESIGSKHKDDSCPEPDRVQRAAPVMDSELLLPFSPNNRNDVTEPNGSVDPALKAKYILSPTEVNGSVDPATNEKGILFPTTGEHTPSDALFQPSSGPPTSIPSLGEDLLNTAVSFELQPTPPVEQPRARPRKRKQYFDETLVLSNKFVNKTIQDASDLVRKRRKIPRSALGIWQLNNCLRKEQIFLQPSLSGMCSDLCNISNKDYISTKSYLFEEVFPDTGVAKSPPPITTEHSPVTETSMGHNDAQSPHRTTEHSPVTEASTGKYAQSPPPFTTEHSPITEAFTGHKGAQSPDTQSAQDPNRHAEDHDRENILSQLITELATGPAPAPNMRLPSDILQTPYLSEPTGFNDSIFETSRTIFEGRLGPENTDPHESLGYRETEDLSFLEADNNTPAVGSQGTQGALDSLSVRTRAAAQYLKGKSPITPAWGETFGDLSMDKILEGKPRKLCARMFYETLVLKTYGLVEVKQELPYGDISLKLTQTLSKAEI